MMNLKAQKALLGQVERDIAESEARVAKQSLRIGRMHSAEREVHLAEGLLRRWEMARQVGKARRTEILRDIAELEAAPDAATGP